MDAKMIKEDYCSFEVSKLLKEKGFNEPCQYFYKFGSNELYKGTVFTNTQIGDIFYNSPTHQMAMKWLRSKGIYMSIDNVISSSGNIYYNIDVYTKESGWEPVVELHTSYEDAVEEALKYCLEELL